jgi:hypothetical protein
MPVGGIRAFPHLGLIGLRVGQGRLRVGPGLIPIPLSARRTKT